MAYHIRPLSRDRDRAREEEVAARLLADTDPLTGLLNRRAFLRPASGRCRGVITLVTVSRLAYTGPARGSRAFHA